MRALVIQHDHVTDPGPVGARLVQRGYDLSVVTVVPGHRHHAPDVAFDFPAADGWDLIVSLGAPWSVYDATKSGTWCDATTATPEMGERYLALGVKSTIAVLENIERTFAAMPPR